MYHQKKERRPAKITVDLLTFAVLVYILLFAACSNFVQVQSRDDNGFWTNGHKILLGGDFSYGDTYKEGAKINNK